MSRHNLFQVVLDMKIERVAIKTQDDVTLDAVVTRLDGYEDAPWVILAHGISVDREEMGTFAVLARNLADAGFHSIRFSFRGHGKSSLHSSQMTISGQLLDLKAIVDWVIQAKGRIAGVVGASFGAVSVSLLAKYLEPRIQCLIFWNPVMDLSKTFLNPTTNWGIKNFHYDKVKNLHRDGVFQINRTFEVGVVFWEELHHFQPVEALLRTTTPLLIAHGDQDSFVPFAISEEVAKLRQETTFLRVEGANHGFHTRKSERVVIDETIAFILSNYK